MNNEQSIANKFEHSNNPLIDAAKPVFIMANSMQSTTSQLPLESLLSKYSILINQFEENAEHNGARYETIQAAKYCLCTFIDEFAVKATWADESWAKKSLLVTFFDETWGGERFFEILNNLKVDINKNIHLIELMYLCLQFGYRGKYQVIDNGELIVEKIERDLYTLINENRTSQIKNLFSQKKREFVAVPKRKRFSIPIWVVAVFAGLGLGLTYFALNWSLGKQFNFASGKVNSLHLKVAENKTDSTFKTIRLAPLLENEIIRNLVSVTDTHDRSTVTILGDGLFQSGSADIQNQYFPVLAAIGQALNSTDGQIIVSGFTDDQPIQSLTYPSNWHLSQGRADAVKAILVKYVNNGNNRVRAEGRGSNSPVVDNNNAENRAKNRRVEIVLFSNGHGPSLGKEAQIKDKI